MWLHACNDLFSLNFALLQRKVQTLTSYPQNELTSPYLSDKRLSTFMHNISACIVFISWLRSHKVNFSVSGPASHLKMTRPPGFYFLLETKVERKWCTNSKMDCGGWGLGDKTIQNAHNCVSKEPKYRSLDGEATVCRLCKQCGCMLNTDYIRLHKSSSSEKIDCTWTRNRKLIVWHKCNLAHHLVLLANYWQGSSWVPTTMLPGRLTILKTLINRMWGYVILEMAYLLHRRCIMWLVRVQSHGSSFFMKGWADLQGHTI